MDDRPLVSYVVTAYNIERFIEESIQCAFRQTYSPLEIVLSDDCSTDGTYEIMVHMVRAYNGPHSVVLNRNPVNLGITQHMNRAYLELASGKLIVAAHGDDLSLPERAEKSWEFLSQHKDFTAVSFSMEAVDEQGRSLRQHSAIVDQPHYYDFKSGGNVPAPSRCFYKSVMEQFGPINPDCPTEDEIISFRALMMGRNAFLPEHMVVYRKHSGSSSNPENFGRFPLDRILNQQNADMKKAVDYGIITEQQRLQKLTNLEQKKRIREKYRTYFASRSMKNLWKLIAMKDVDGKQKFSYVKEHMKWMISDRMK